MSVEPRPPLPIARPASRGAGLRPIAGGAADDDPTTTRMPVVLVADDHADTREMYAVFLGTMGLATLQATTCAETLACVGRTHVDLLVVDRRLPDGDGADVVRTLKADARTRGVPMIVLSGQPRDASVDADAYLVKPVVPDALYAEIMRLLASRGAGSTS